MTVDPAAISRIEIFPPINIARVGDSDEYYLGPEIPGREPIPEGGFRDSQHKIKRMAARYRVYAYGSDGRVLGEVTDDGSYTLKWRVEVANKKCAWVHFRGQYRPETWQLRNGDVQGWPDDNRDYEYTNQRNKLIIHSIQTVSGVSAAKVPLKGPIDFSTDANPSPPLDVHLGDILTDASGRLLVLASDGKSFNYDQRDVPQMLQPELPGTFDSDRWVDCMCDGKVEVEVEHKGTGFKKSSSNKSTIITAPPKYTPGMHCPTTLYELIEDIYERPKRSQPGYDVGEVNYYKHIYPMFQRLYALSWTNIRANEGHGPRRAEFWLDNPKLSNPDSSDEDRKYIFGRIRAPVKKGNTENEALRTQQAQAFYMPRLGGNNSDLPEWYNAPNDRDRWASLTELQYDRLSKWANGNFVTGSPIAPPASFDEISLEQQPSALTESAIEWSVGMPLYPGIETWWISEFSEHYNPDVPFRYADTTLPGDLGKGLALPWQSDFYMCNTHWWPSVRPDNIVTEQDFQATLANFQGVPTKVAVNLTKRTLWDDGLNRDHPEDPNEVDDRIGSSEMVRKWNLLGFLGKLENYGNAGDVLPVYIEKERHPDFPHTN